MEYCIRALKRSATSLQRVNYSPDGKRSRAKFNLLVVGKIEILRKRLQSLIVVRNGSKEEAERLLGIPSPPLLSPFLAVHTDSEVFLSCLWRGSGSRRLLLFWRQCETRHATVTGKGSEEARGEYR